jgi:GMP synthase (glutamine-hydrolysing)
VNVHWLQHVPVEELGSMEAWLRGRGRVPACTRLYAGDPLPDLGRVDWLIVMGGPMNIYEDARYPWLAPERRFIREAIQAGKHVLGICLGAQLVADALGGKVRASSQKEIGWFPVRRTEEAARSPLFGPLPEQLEVFHWHGDTFDLPAGAIRLAASEACANQAFAYGERVLGLQFHPEMTPVAARRLIEACTDDLVDGPFIQKAEAMLSNPGRFENANRILAGILDRFQSAR